LYKRIISRLDIKNGNLVKGISLEGARNLGSPDYFSYIYYSYLIDEVYFHNIFATQYPPKKSGEPGLKIYKNFTNLN
jgi:imidazole glycerol phosphate synthase subunit HisF